MDSVLEDITELRSQIRRLVNRIEDAEKAGKSEAYILSLNQQLAELMKKENILLERQSGQIKSAGTKS